MTPLIFVDFETRSRADLKKIGGRLYAEHPTTEVLCGVTLEDSGYDEPLWYEAVGEGIAAQGDWLRGLGAFDAVAHNAIGFDRHVWRRLGWPEPRRWIDTAELARVAGYPEASLEWLGANLCGHPKDLEGNKLTIGLSRVSRAKKTLGQLPPVTPEILARVVQYCRRDVELMVRLYREHLSPWDNSDVPGLVEADRAVIDRGICFDRDLAETLLLADECLRDAALEAAGVEDATELWPARLKNHFLALGVKVDDCTSDTLDALDDELAAALAEESSLTRLPSEWVALHRARALITARRALSSIAAGKLRAGLLRCSSDGRLRDNTRYYGAHTGRWSGSGMQLQNMAAGADIDVEATIELLKQGRLEAVYLVEEKQQ
jgi:DNA polymerase bacteriophage-type